MELSRRLFICGLLCLPLTEGINTICKVNPKYCYPLIAPNRGAAGYVPEHTSGAHSLAVLLGADFVKLDVVLTQDGHLIVRHDNELGSTTDVSKRSEFKDRYQTKTVDGKNVTGWFSEDFTLEEIKSLRAVERIPKIRPCNTRLNGSFGVPTFSEIVILVQSLQSNLNRNIGIFVEIKHSTYFKNLGLPIESHLVSVLRTRGYSSAQSPAAILSLEVNNLKRLKSMTNLQLIQVYGTNQSSQPFDQVLSGTTLTYGQMATRKGLKDVATYAYAIIPPKSFIIPRDANNKLTKPTRFVQHAHDVGLKVYPYAFRAENFFLPSEYRSNDPSVTALGNLKGELNAFLATRIDGVFIDEPDVASRLREKLN